MSDTIILVGASWCFGFCLFVALFFVHVFRELVLLLLLLFLKIIISGIFFHEIYNYEQLAGKPLTGIDHKLIKLQTSF